MKSYTERDERSLRVEPSIVRKFNERRVLNAIRLGKTMSRADIQRKLLLSMPTVMKIVDGLIAQGWVLEVGTGDFTLGRPPVMLEINSRSAVAIGVDLGRSRVRVVCVNLLAEVVAEDEIDSESVGNANDLIDYLQRTLRVMGVDPASVIGIGLAAPGSRNPHPDSPQRLGGMDQNIYHHWHAEDLEERIVERLGIKAWLENDANAAVLGEMWFGGGQSARHLVFVLADEGVGAGIAVNGSIYMGEHNVAGEFAHMIVDMHGEVECECGRRGCLGGIAHLGGIREGLRKLGVEVAGSLAPVFTRAKRGAEPEAAVVARSLDYLAAGIFNLIQVIDPSMVILGGRLFRIDPFAVEEIQRRVRDLTWPKRIPIEASAFGASVVAIGAATLVLQHVYDHTKLVNLSDEAVEAPIVTL